MDIFEDERVVSRTDLAAWLRQLADQLDSGGKIFFGAAGTVTVADQVRCELEIERESSTEISMEIEFTWVEPGAAAVAAVEEAGDDEAGQDGEEVEEEEEVEVEEDAAEGADVEETTEENIPAAGSVV
ncbi:MAG TPA: amphi-Trp domain-containing protein [Micromonosporaceae bacterium]|nr:amphi-Trp domain-containing protein [Micromonosporaceae bacterium]